MTPRGRHLFAYDLAVTALAILLSFAIRFEANDIGRVMAPYLPAAFVPLLIHPPIYVAFGLYRREWQYASVRELYAIAAAVALATALSFGALIVLAAIGAPGSIGFPRSVFLIQALLAATLVGGGRFVLRASLDRTRRGPVQARRLLATLVYGAGEAGATVARLIERDPASEHAIVGFIDDDPRKHSSRLLGHPVHGGLDDLAAAVERTRADALLIAMPSAPGTIVRRAFEAGRALGLDVRTVPSLREVVTGHATLSRIRRVRVEDLLSRASVSIDGRGIDAYINGASVLVTGGGGSIGSELVRQIVRIGPRALTVLDNHEWALWSIDQEVRELRLANAEVQYRSVLGDIRSARTIEAVIRAARPDVIFHAAALKHVAIVERFPSEGVLTNVVGTRNLLNAAVSAGVARVVLISSDKAVEPASVMGATKRLAEDLTVATGIRTGRAYSAVRFGNVLGSSGSVLPVFERQLAEGRPITITHPDATRYFMTIPEAVTLILEAGATDAAGAVFVLDMGEPIRIVDLARDLIRLSGLDPDAVPIAFTGLAPGERLHEHLTDDSERLEPTRNEGILRVASYDQPSPERLEAMVSVLEASARDGDDAGIREILRSRRYLGVSEAPVAESSARS